MRQIILSLLVIGMGAAWLYIFATFAVRGSFYAVEPSTAILWAEIAGFAGATLFGLWMFTEEVTMREKKHGHRKPRR